MSRKYTKASDIGSAAYCPATIHNKHKKLIETRQSFKKKIEGEKAHSTLNDAVERDRRCFIATAIYGENAKKTSQLRTWRDEALLYKWYGHFIVFIYYRLSPHIVNIIKVSPKLECCFRMFLDWFVKKIERS